jgi:probable F420-dependent oxidoreductase
VIPRFGLGLPIVQQVPHRAQAWEAAAGGPELGRIARAAELLGYAYVSCSDHVLVPRSRSAAMGEVWYDAAVTLAYLAGVTERIGLLSHVLILPYRHPLVVAKAFGTLDRLSGGRVILGVGSGHVKPEFRILGARYERRGVLTDEYLEAIRAAWAGGVVAFAGKHVAFGDIVVAPGPVQRPDGRAQPPVWIGGNSPAAVCRAARHGDGWIPWQITPRDFAVAAARARGAAADAGRGPLELVAPLAVAMAEGTIAISGRVEEWLAAGATGFHVGIGHDGLERFLDRLEWFAREVMARFA